MCPNFYIKDFVTKRPHQHNITQTKRHPFLCGEIKPNNNKQIMADKKPGDLRPKYWIYSCKLCKQDHPVKTCPMFLGLGPDERFDFVCENLYCLNCLACSHTRVRCPTTLTCQICDERHNTLLHFAKQMPKSNQQRQSRPTERPPQKESNRSKSSSRLTVRPPQHESARSKSSSRPQHSHVEQRKTEEIGSQKIPQRRPPPSSSQAAPYKCQDKTSPQPSTSKAAQLHQLPNESDFKMVPKPSVPFTWSKVFIPTAHIKILMPKQPGMWHICRASINPHAIVSRIAVSLQTKLNLDTFVYRETRFVKMVVGARIPRFKWQREINAMLTNDLPRKPYEKPIVEDPTEDFTPDTLADPDPRCNTAIDIELGGDVYWDLYRNGSIYTNVPQILAQNTAIGYTFTGAIGKLW
ncbi:uncharacterized protein isoform X1 [Musca autumnalis]|uniref:uncharacterized protein isoform X1 n=2 Tax=Musca autumnalis TaxID=221902 RepID=UPI003CFADB4D